MNNQEKRDEVLNPLLTKIDEASEEFKKKISQITTQAIEVMKREDTDQ